MNKTALLTKTTLQQVNNLRENIHTFDQCLNWTNRRFYVFMEETEHEFWMTLSALNNHHLANYVSDRVCYAPVSAVTQLVWIAFGMLLCLTETEYYFNFSERSFVLMLSTQKLDFLNKQNKRS